MGQRAVRSGWPTNEPRITAVSMGVLLAAACGTVTACSILGPEQHICEGDQVVVERSVHGPGSYCQDRKPSDTACPDGQATRLVLSLGREDCIPNDVDHERDGLDP